MRSYLVLAVFLILDPACSAQDDAVKLKLQALYDQVDALKLKKDADGLAKYLASTRTPDYVFEAKSGRHNLAEMIKSMRTVFKLFDKVTRATVHIDTFKLDGTTATVVITSSTEMKTKMLEDKRFHTIAEEATGVDTWVKKDGDWKLKYSRSLKEAFIKDGKRLPEK